MCAGKKRGKSKRMRKLRGKRAVAQEPWHYREIKGHTLLGLLKGQSIMLLVRRLLTDSRRVQVLAVLGRMASSQTTVQFNDVTSSMSLRTRLQMNDGNYIPILGMGTWEASGNECTTALKLGYRLLDTATCYTNEANIGKALKDSGVSRKDVVVTTKIWETDHGREKTLASFSDSLKR